MLRNYLTIARRNLLKHKAISGIVVFGLASSIAAFLLIIQFVLFEFSYDDFHENADAIYRLRLDDYKQGTLTNSSVISYYAAAPAIKEMFPEVDGFVRLHRADGMISHQKTTGELVSHHERAAFYADSSFFHLFSFPLLQGSARQVLRKPESVVISNSAARKYFGRENPVGKTLRLSSEWQSGTYVVEGVFADVPLNSHIHFDFVFSIENLLKNRQFANGGWYWTNFYTYLLLKPDISSKAFEARVSDVITKHMGDQLRRYKIRQRFVLQPLRSIHLHSQTDSEIEPNGRIEIVYILIVVSILLLVIGWLNYINLSTAKGIDRAKEVGIRKVLGSERKQIIQQFLFESSVVHLFSLLIGVGLFLGIRAMFDQWLQMPIGLFIVKNLSFWAIALLVICSGSLLSGFYPAFVLSLFKPIAILKGRLPRQASGEMLRRILVVFQFTTSIVLIISTLVINQQIIFMKKQDLGMTIRQQLVIKAPRLLQTDSFTNEFDYFKNQILAHQDITYVTASSSVAGEEIFWTNEFQRLHTETTDFKLCNVMAVDEDFIPAYKIKLLAGRNFYKKLILDNDAVIINQSALKAFGFSTPESAINQEIGNEFSKKIIGVVRDFHHQSLKTANHPIIFQHIPWSSAYLTLSLQTKNTQHSIAKIQKIFQKAFPGNAFEWFFLDDRFQQQYKSDERIADMLGFFTLLAICIACLGLSGLAMFIARSRTKEIGIRKTLGASTGSIVVLLSRDFLKLILIAILLAVPIAWYAAHQWLQKYAYRIDISWWVFALAGIIATGIALLTISIQSIKAASMNPIKSLRSE